MLFEEKVSERLDWVTSRGPFQSALPWFKELGHKGPKTFIHTQVCEQRMRTEVAQDGEQTRKQWIVFPSKKEKVKAEQLWKLFATFLPF